MIGHSYVASEAAGALRWGLFALLFALCLPFAPTEARAWEPFLSAAPDVERGNVALRGGSHAEALREYEEAARRLPGEAGVHLNRGLALLAGEDAPRAREALLLATTAPASRPIRADAFYNIGLSFYRDADAAATADDHEQAQSLFREAADAFRNSLRQRPGNADAGWNLELALRRIQEQEQEQEEEEQEQQEQDENQDQEQDPDQDQEQDSDQEGQEQDDQNSQDQEQDQDQEGQDPQESDDSEDGEQSESDDPSGESEEQDSQEGDEGEEEQENEDPSDGEEEQSEEEGDDAEQPSAESQEEQNPGQTGDNSRAMPQEHQRVLEALQDQEQNLERQRARARARQERRRVEQDW